MLSHEETMALVKQAQQGDEEAAQTLLNENTPLLKCIVKRYVGKHVEYDDLFQIAGIGLLKAVKNFRSEFNVRFSTYAVPMILGEIKRHMRDDGYIKVSRSLKSLSGKIAKYVDQLVKDGEDPSVDKIAEHRICNGCDKIAGVAVRNHQGQGRQTDGTCRPTSDRRGSQNDGKHHIEGHVVQTDGTGTQDNHLPLLSRHDAGRNCRKDGRFASANITT